MRVRAVEHEEVAIRGARANQFLDLLEHVAHFGAFRLGLEGRDLFAFRALREERLGLARLILRDQLVCGFENRLRRAVVFFEFENFCALEIFLELEDHFVIAAAP